MFFLLILLFSFSRIYCCRPSSSSFQSKIIFTLMIKTSISISSKQTPMISVVWMCVQLISIDKIDLFTCNEVRWFSNHNQRLGTISEIEISDHMSHVHVTTNNGLYLFLYCGYSEFSLSKSVDIIRWFIQFDVERNLLWKISSAKRRMCHP